MVQTPAEIKIFYSWQSDLPDSTNRAALRQALRVAATAVEDAIKGVRVTIDEATRDRPGSPNIPATILEKIEAADIVVADVSIINGEKVSKTENGLTIRRSPNPNVVFELGYAVAYLGWDRIILIFNENFGTVAELPFDFDRHRVSFYNLSENSTKNDRSKVSELLGDALLAITRAAPEKPSELRNRSIEKVKRQRDLDNLKRTLSTIHIPSLQEHSEDYPYRILDSVEYCWLDFDHIVRSAQFHINDKDLDAAIRALHEAWGQSLAYAQEYHPNSNHTAYVFMRYDDPAYMTQGDHQKHWDEMNSARNKLRIALQRLLTIVNERYVEIDVRELSNARWALYQEWLRKLRDSG